LVELSVHVRPTAEVVVAEPERLVGAFSGVYVITVAIRESFAPLVLLVRTAPISSVLVDDFTIERPLYVVVARPTGVVPESE
jgi:hypothetical protein